MKYGESFFDIGYLVFAIVSGWILINRSRSRLETDMGIATLVLGLGDAFHLVPRILNYFLSADMNAALGIGKAVTSITMTVFYVYLYSIWVRQYRRKENSSLRTCIGILALIRIVLCLFPQNGWIQNSGNMTWAVLRNIPFVLLGGLICFLYYQTKDREPVFRQFWLYIFFSFLFYMPVAIGAGAFPMLGMLMLPKTICYILMILVFLKNQKQHHKKGGKKR